MVRPPQGLDDLVGGRLGDLDQREPVGDLDRPDVPAGEVGLAGDRPDQIVGPEPGQAAGADEQAGRSLPGGAAGVPGPVRGRCDGAVASWSDRAGASGISSSSAEGPPASWASLTAASATSRRSNSSARGLHRRAEALEVAVEEDLPQRRPGEVQPPGPQVGGGGQPLDGDPVPAGPFDRLEHPLLAGLGQGDRHALAPGPADPPDAVYVGVGRRRDVVVDDVGELLEVEAPGGDVGGHHQVRRAAPEPAHDAVPLLLVHPAVERFGVVAPPGEGLGEPVHLVAGPAEDQGRGRRLEVQDPPEGRGLGGPGHDVGDVAHQSGIGAGDGPPGRSGSGRGRGGGAGPSRRSGAASSPRREPSGGRGAPPPGSIRCPRRNPCRASRRPRRGRPPPARPGAGSPGRCGRGPGPGWPPPRRPRPRGPGAGGRSAARRRGGRRGRRGRARSGASPRRPARPAPGWAPAPAPSAPCVIPGRAAPAPAGRRPPSCRSPSPPARPGPGPPAAAGSSRAGWAWAPRSRDRTGPGAARDGARGRRRYVDVVRGHAAAPLTSLLLTSWPCRRVARASGP